MAIADDVLSRLRQLEMKRMPFESVWREINKLMFPTSMGGSFDAVVTGSLGAFSVQPASTKMPNIVDSTGMWALDRLAAGIESLVSPINATWHGIGFNDLWAGKPNDYDNIWFDTQRDFLFAQRYNPRSGFRRSNQMAIRGTVAYGHGDFMVEEWFGEDGVKLPYRYIFVPTSEGYLDKDAYGEVNVFYRQYTMSAFNAALFFGHDKLPPKIKIAANDPKDKSKEFRFIHAIEQRGEAGSGPRGSIKTSRYASYYVNVEENALVRDSGYFSFPIVHYEWSPVPNSPYAESPAMLALADVKTSQLIATMELRASQQFVDPALALPPKGQIGRPDLNSRALNYGALTARGDLLIRPIITATAPTFAQAILEARRNNTRETLYLNLFQALMDNKSMTATEALLKDQERAMILGPAGTRLQEGQGFMVEREIDILMRKGAYDPNGPLAPPDGSAGRDFGAKFTSPLDRLMASGELVGMMRLFEIMGALAQARPEVLDNIEPDETLRRARHLLGAPASMIVPFEKVLQMREQRAQAEQQTNMIGMAQEAAKAAKDVAPLVKAQNEAANMPGQAPGVEESARSARAPGPRRRVR